MPKNPASKKRKRVSGSSTTKAIACQAVHDEAQVPIEACDLAAMDEPLLCRKMRDFVEDKPLALSLDETVFLRAVTKDKPCAARPAVVSWLKKRLVLGCADSGSNACISLFDIFEFTQDPLIDNLWLLRPHFSKVR
jgi:hypothetical protein